MEKQKAVFNWSGGKDSALALHKILNDDLYEVVALLTTINEETLTSSVHSIPLEILKKQADSIGIALHTVLFAKDLSNYNDKMSETVAFFKKQGVTHFIFGDIFLEDIKSYRESKLNPLGIEVVEPLWNKSSKEIIEEFLKSGIKAKIIVAQANKLDQSFIGRVLNKETIDLFPKDIDFCGENGEYHTLAYAGGLFKKELNFTIVNSKTITYDIKLSNNEIETFAYHQAILTV